MFGIAATRPAKERVCLQGLKHGGGGMQGAGVLERKQPADIAIGRLRRLPGSGDPDDAQQEQPGQEAKCDSNALSSGDLLVKNQEPYGDGRKHGQEEHDGTPHREAGSSDNQHPTYGRKDAKTHRDERPFRTGMNRPHLGNTVSSC